MGEPHRFRGLVLAGCLALLLGACTQIENPRVLAPGQPEVDQTRSGELARIQFDDIPSPRGFEFVTRGNRSFSYRRGGVRVGRFIFWGRSTAAEVADFYRSTMPLQAYGWTLTGETSDETEAGLTFRKNLQDCSVDITQDNRGIYVTIFVSGPA